ncbi:hypothetical protein KL938_002854 [Ogataea parapolymorpha]|nr:hypothetical protein KL938_002854 [Ogataea parapolymorpha]
MSILQEKIQLNNGTAIPVVGLGTVTPDDKKPILREVVRTAILDAGYRHIDTAWYYGVEPILGEVLEEIFNEGKIKREDIFITTKVWPALWSNPQKSLDKSLKDLRVDYVDLWLQHWPLTFKSDENGQPPVPRDSSGKVIEDDGDFLDTYKKMVDIYKNSNKVKAIGVSNYSIGNLDRLLKETDVVPVINQIELHPQLPLNDLVEFCNKHKIVVEAYSPFGSNGAPVLELPLVKQLAEKYNVRPADILVNYHTASGRVALPRSRKIVRDR